jgi:lysophospholipase L1-like esterase
VATGGSPTGGKATGGTATGGTASGGKASGGAGGSGAAANITLWLAGDSTMQNCSSPCPCGWGSQFDPYFNSRVTVTNNAVGGRSIQTWLYESNVSSTLGSDGECGLTSTTYASRWTTMLNSMKSGDYLFIAFGINDGDSTCPRHVGSARFQTLMTTMVTTAKGLGVNPILLTPTAAIACSGSTATKNRGFITETKAVATATGVPVIDLNQLSVDLYNSLGLCPNAADYTSTTSAVGLFFCNDHTHFEAAGAQQIAGSVANALRTQGIPLAAYLN